MTKDLPDFQSEIVSAAVEATALRNGLDANKPATPAKGDIWLATDTGYLYVCFTAGSWEKVAKLYLELAGGTLTGNIAMGGNKVTGLGAPTASTDAARKSEVDTVNAKLDDISHAEPGNALDTIYQNTGGKIRQVVVSARCRVAESGGSLDGSSRIDAEIGSTSPPGISLHNSGILLDAISGGAGADFYHYASLTFDVPPNWYYRIVTVATVNGQTPVLLEWHEFDHH